MQGRSSDEAVRASASSHENEQRQQDPHFAELHVDDSFSEERFATLPAASSWESQSLDSEARPSSRTSLRDRRKQFDVTTPTLIDEDGGDDDDDREIASLERQRTLDGEDVPSDIRRTPGASMLRSSFEYSPDNMRRTPGASAIQASGVNDSFDFGLALSASAAGEEPKQKQGGLWDATGESPSVSEQEAQRPITSSSASGRTEIEPRGPFSFSSWSRTAHSSGNAPSEGRPGAFSPNTMRLKADLGNLLQDDDDYYGLEVKNTFRGVHDNKVEYNEDWTGAYVFDSSSGKSTVSRNYMNLREGNQKETRQRRRQGGHGAPFLQHAQQPKPRRSSNEVFEFGKASRTGDEMASTQLINFGGAFAPPSSFSRPTPPPSRNDASQQPSGLISAGATGTSSSSMVGGPPQSFMRYTEPQFHRAPPPGSFIEHPNRFAPPSPIQFAQEEPPALTRSASEMQATAREFVPMARSTTPLVVVPQWTHIDPDSHSWNTGTCIVQNYGYTASAASFDPRMTPSPHLWQPQGPPESYGMVTTNSMEPLALRGTLSTPTPSQASTETASHPLQQRKKETKRGKRGKKKSQKEISSTSLPGKKTPTRKSGKTRPSSTTHGTDADEGGASATDVDPVGAKRAELVESPATKSAFKGFYREFRTEERVSFQKAEEYALQAVDSGRLPERVHWRVYLELADLAKRSNRFSEARRLYQKVCELQPYAFQGWLEYSKLEEECGHLSRVMAILQAGLEYCEFNETLMTRAVKLQEKMGNVGEARALLARLKHVSIDKVWKTVLEGALVEARAGNVSTARKVLKYLMHHVPWYGPLYLEAYRLERDQRCIDDALLVVKRGLNAIPRYGPLWFGAFRLCEEIDLRNANFHLPSTMEMIERATGSISKELVWKVHLEAAQMFERAALRQRSIDDPLFDELLEPSRCRLALTILTCPNSLRWKVWLASGRMELGFGNSNRARALFLRAHRSVPDKGRSSTIVECSRLEEFLGDVHLARAILCKGCLDYGHDWKVWLEGVLLEIRDGNFARATEICSKALAIHGGTGRLWACLVQLQQFNGGDRAQNAALRRALNAVPKSGEVWCEGSRIRLNPFSDTFDPERARRYLFYATRFTPQYGDSFIEGIRLEIIHQWLLPIADYIWAETRDLLKPIKATSISDHLTKYVTDISLAASIARLGEEQSLKGLPKLAHSRIVPTLTEFLKLENLRRSIDLSELQLACANADPNYGSLWFYCRRGNSDPPRAVFEYASEQMMSDVFKFAHIYLASIMRRKAILSMSDLEKAPVRDGTDYGVSDPRVAEWEDKADETLLSYTTLHDIINPVDPTTGFMLLDSTVDGSLFVAGLTDLNKDNNVASMALKERKRAIFGNDALFP